MNIMEVIQPLMYMVGDTITWLFATDLIPGLFSIGTVLFAGTVMYVIMQVVSVLFRKTVDDGGSTKQWRKQG